AAIAVFVAVAVITMYFAADIPPRPPSAAKQHTVECAIAYSETVVQVTNTGASDWNEAVIYINGTPPNAYRITRPAPKVGQSLKIPLRDFAKPDGKRFNPGELAVTDIWIGG